jgi:hypothetical protein
MGIPTPACRRQNLDFNFIKDAKLKVKLKRVRDKFMGKYFKLRFVVPKNPPSDY